MTELSSATPTWTRYVAIGDSFTEGLWDLGPDDDTRCRGWADILAAHLSTRRTDAAIAALVARGGPLVAILWGKDAQALAGALGATPVVASAHPSPLSARRGFIGSRPFSRVNALLVEQGAPPVDWSLP